MNRYIPISKQTKKQKKAHYSKRRNTWGDVRPVTRVVKSRKLYDRARQKQESRERGREE